MHLLSTSSPLPLYAQLADLLRQRIARGDWQEGDRLPSHDAMTREFSVARVTVRQAIDLLQTDGLVQARQGSGTFVTARPGATRRLAMQSTLAGLVDMLRGDEPQLLMIAEGRADPPLSAADGHAARRYVFMRRVHVREGTPYGVISLYLDESVFRRAPRRFRQELAVPILATLPGLRIAQARQTLTIGAADSDAASHLGLVPGAPVAHVRRVFRDPADTVIYLAEVTYRGDLVQLTMDLSP